MDSFEKKGEGVIFFRENFQVNAEKKKEKEIVELKQKKDLTEMKNCDEVMQNAENEVKNAELQKDELLAKHKINDHYDEVEEVTKKEKQPTMPLGSILINYVNRKESDAHTENKMVNN